MTLVFVAWFVLVGFSGVWYCCCVYVAGFGFLGCLLRRIGGLVWMFCVRGLVRCFVDWVV